MDHAMGNELAAMVQGYLSAAAFCANYINEDGTFESSLTTAMGKGPGAVEFSEDELRSLFDIYAIIEAVTDCIDFCEGVEDNGELSEGHSFAVTELRKMLPSQAGHNFYLSRNGHGAGFFDLGLGWAGTVLQDAAKVYGETCINIEFEGRAYDA